MPTRSSSLIPVSPGSRISRVEHVPMSMGIMRNSAAVLALRSGCVCTVMVCARLACMHPGAPALSAESSSSLFHQGTQNSSAI